jgi:PHD/YefM family antitoxin component YafN of YafNO toxin-antitoxin module
MKLIPQAESSRLLRHLDHENTAVVTDARGNAAAYLLDYKTFREMQNRITLLEGIARGEKAIAEGRVMTQAQAKKKMARWLKNQ